MSEEEKEEIKRFLDWLPEQGVIGRIMHNMMTITTEVVDTEGDVAGRIDENLLLGDTTLQVLQPEMFIGTEYYEWAIDKHNASVERVENRLILGLDLARRLLQLLVKFMSIPLPTPGIP